jgi:hypothetical protein
MIDPNLKPTQQWIVGKRSEIGRGTTTGFSVVDKPIDTSNPEHVIVPLRHHTQLREINIEEYFVTHLDKDYEILKLILDTPTDEKPSGPYFIVREIN